MEHTMKDSNRSSRARISALALSAAVTMAAVIGLTTASEYQGPRRILSTDANAQLDGVAATGGGVPSVPPGVPNDDPELMRIDRANEHHG
jgi:hypothetical protein